MAPIQRRHGIHRREWPSRSLRFGLLFCLVGVSWSEDTPGAAEETTTEADDAAEETTTKSAENAQPDDTTVLAHDDAPVNNPGPTTGLTWLSLIGGSYYINLPATDNWSEYGPLRTEWRKLRLKEIPHVGQTSVVVDLHDTTFATSNGETSSGQDLQRIEWGIAADCQSQDVQSEMRVNLVGTPFRYDPVYAQATGTQAHGSVECGPANKQCSASCGGWCGHCGLGVAGTTATARLMVVDQAQFDDALKALLQAMLEALKTTTVTRTTGPTSTSTRTTQTTTKTTFTETETVTTTTAVVLGLSKKKEEEEGETGSHIFGTVVVLMLVAGFGICFGLWVRKHGCPSWLGRAYGRFEDNVAAKPAGAMAGHKLPPHKLGGARIPQV